MRGEWRFEAGWPVDRGHELVLELSTSSALPPDRAEDQLDVRGDVGVHASISCAGHLPFGQPMDQRPDEAWSLMYDWPPLEEEVEVLGYPRFEVTVRSSAPVAFLAAKLCDVFEDGTSALVSRGFLNLTHRTSHWEPEALVPGNAYAVTVPLDATSWVFDRGHRIRLDVAGADWPNVWPPPGPLSLTVERPGSRLVLPTVSGPPPDAGRPSFAPPRAESQRAAVSSEDLESRPGVRGSAGIAPEPVWRVEHDVLGRETRVVIEHGAENALEGGGLSIERYRGETGVSTVDPGSAWAQGRASFTLEWPEVTVGTEARTVLRSDATAWHVEIELDVSEGGRIRWQRRWARRLPRNLA